MFLCCPQLTARLSYASPVSYWLMIIGGHVKKQALCRYSKLIDKKLIHWNCLGWETRKWALNIIKYAITFSIAEPTLTVSYVYCRHSELHYPAIFIKPILLNRLLIKLSKASKPSNTSCIATFQHHKSKMCQRNIWKSISWQVEQQRLWFAFYFSLPELAYARMLKKVALTNHHISDSGGAERFPPGITNSCGAHFCSVVWPTSVLWIWWRVMSLLVFCKVKCKIVRYGMVLKPVHCLYNKINSCVCIRSK